MPLQMLALLASRKVLCYIRQSSPLLRWNVNEDTGYETKNQSSRLLHQPGQHEDARQQAPAEVTLKQSRRCHMCLSGYGA